jgi:hypothetical protein
MNSVWRIGTLVLLIAALSACHDDTEAVHPEEYTPELYSFDLIDSYDQDTARPPYTDLALNPSQYEGMFEIFWRVNSLEDYTMSLRISDRPLISTSLSVHSEICGAGRWCDQSGSLICEYTSDFYLSCDNSNNPLDIVDFFPQVPPQQLYLFLEVCDNNSSYCEYDYYPVIFE